NSVVKKRIANFSTFIFVNIDVMSKDKDGNTALHIAANENNVAHLKLLLDNGADIDSVNNE
ncbi:hypothetical protein B4U80_14688, partial [Leptotrombidium deliense]